jgi:glucuronate isomerase
MPATDYIHDDFLLETEAARRLFHEYAEGAPIVDFHCHLSPAEIARDRRWENVTQLWLHGDHYKWRAMRANGVPERFCTGDATDREKFDRWAETVPWLVRNQLYPWTHLELARYFGIDGLLLGPETADHVWERCSEKLAEPWFSARGIMKKFNVTVVCTTDDPVDSLEHHRAIAEDGSFDVKVLPAWRPDRGMDVAKPDVFNVWVDRLAAAADVDVKDFDSYVDALRRRHEFFHEAGCRLSDHGIETFCAEDYSGAEIKAIFDRARTGAEPGGDEVVRFRSAMLHEFAVMDHEKGWAQQFHYGVLRNCNTRLFEKLGPDIGCDSMGDFEVARPLAKFLDRLDRRQKLARTILYNMNPRDNALLATMLGSFQDGSCPGGQSGTGGAGRKLPGKMQLGSAWWVLDQKDGMEQQMIDLSQTGLLSRFVGMVTDSRSFLSYPRHEYFRRVLANLLGNDMERGYVPKDFDLVGRMVRDISCENASRYFGF